MSLFAAYEEVFGLHPRALLLLDRTIDFKLVQQFTQARATTRPASYPRVEGDDVTDTRFVKIRPLISHHHFNPHSVFSSGTPASISSRALALLVAHDGLVISDPTAEVTELVESGHQQRAVDRFREITEGLAELEPLVDKEVLDFTSLRPGTRDERRRRVLDAFGIDPDFTVFVNFAQAAPNAAKFEQRGGTLFVDQADQLLALFGLPPVKTRSVIEARRRIWEVAQSLIHLSWSISVCSAEARSDLTLHGELEEDLFSALIERDFDLVDPVLAGHEKTRHFQKVASGEVPHIDTLELSIPDALAMRNDDVFGSFRYGLHKALDHFDAVLSDSPGEAGRRRAELRFEESMTDLSISLGAQARKSPYSRFVRDAAIPTGIAAITTFLPVVGIVLSAVPVLLAWLEARSESGGKAIAVRYAATLGKPRNRLGR